MRLRGEYEVKSDEDRVKLIADLVEEGSQDGLIRKLSLDIINNSGVREKDSYGEIKAIFGWVKKNIAYRGDVFCRDSYHTAKRVIKLRSGDCDDHCILLCSMLASVGYPVGCRIMSSKKNVPFHHIYALVNAAKYSNLGYRGKQDWLPLDSTDKSNDVGEEPDWAKKRDFVFTCGD